MAKSINKWRNITHKKQLSDETNAAVFYENTLVFAYSLEKLFCAPSFNSIIYQKACCQKCTS